MSSKSYIDVKVVGSQAELKDFLRLLRVIQYCGEIGTCQTIKVTVDGDGSGRLSFYINGSDEKLSGPVPDKELWIGE